MKKQMKEAKGDGAAEASAQATSMEARTCVGNPLRSPPCALTPCPSLTLSRVRIIQEGSGTVGSPEMKAKAVTKNGKSVRVRA